MLPSGFSKIYKMMLFSIRRVPWRSVLVESCNNTTLTSSQLESLCQEKLTGILLHAVSSVPGYKKKYSGFNLDDFFGLPVLEKSELINSKSDFLSDNIQGRLFSGSTSGSTGDSLEFIFDSARVAWEFACKSRARMWWGVRPFDTSLIIWGRPISGDSTSRMISSMKSWMRGEKHFNSFDSLNINFAKRIHGAFGLTRFDYVYGYGSSLTKVAQLMEENNLSIDERKRPKLVQYTADHMSEQDRNLVSSIFGCPVMSDYGGSEAPGIAAECQEGNLHIFSDAYYVEILDKNNKPVNDGEVGDICITTLENRAMPLIRYRIGDIGSRHKGSCPCGSKYPMMKLAVGKTIDLISTSFVSDISAHFLDYVNIKVMRSDLLNIRKFKVFQVNLDEFVVEYVSGEGEEKEGLRIFDEEMKKKLGPVQVSFKCVENIDLESTGKHRYFKKVF